MARKRMLSNGIWRDKKIIKLSSKELIVWIGCISIADDEGILEPDADSLFYELARRDMTVEEIDSAIKKLESDEINLLVPYGPYAFIPTWYKHQSLNRPSKTKLKRPPKDIVENYPDYIEGWESTFSYWTGKGDNREKVYEKYPFRERSVQIDGKNNQFTDNSVSTHGVFSEHSVSTHSEEKRREEKGIEENTRTTSTRGVGDADPFEDDWGQQETESEVPENVKSINDTLFTTYGRFMSGEEIDLAKELVKNHYPARVSKELRKVVKNREPPKAPIHYIHSYLKDQYTRSNGKKAAEVQTEFEEVDF